MATKKVLNVPSLSSYGFTNGKELINYQLSPDQLQDLSVKNGLGKETASGVLVVKTGKFTGRSPKDRFIVKDHKTKDEVWWGDINIPFEPDKFDALYNKVVDYLSQREIYVRDLYACAAKDYQLNVRVINEYPWSNMFAYNMFLRPTDVELDDFQEDWLVVNAPGFMADPEIDGTRQENFAILDFTKKIVLIGGTAYTGEIKKGIFSALNFILPMEYEALSMHCSANVGEEGNTALFFGLSGTGKTTLSADPKRKLIGDDEHGWTKDNLIFNFEGGCYAKTINLSSEKEPDIYDAIRPGAILENVVLNDKGEVDFEDATITQNTRVSYPIEFIKNIKQPSVGKNPKNVFFLTADAFGVLPPVSRLTPGQAAYHFVSGYTAKVAGTEAGVTEPIPSFSACFGAPFMPLHPTRYAVMLSQRMKLNGTNVWLINTGWTGGPYGVGERIKLPYTRAIVEAALSDELNHVSYITHEVFGLEMPVFCPGVPNDILNPKLTWSDSQAYDLKAYELAKHFRENFVQYENMASPETMAAQPKIK